MTTLVYSIHNDIPGGGFTSANELRLRLLIQRDLSTSLNQLKIQADTLRLVFSGSLPAEEKTALDGDTLPVGGLIAASTQKIAILVDGEVKTDNSRVEIPADRITFKTITLQKQHHDDSSADGEAEIVALEPASVGAISALDGELDSSGAFEFILGPDVKRGAMSITIGVENFSPLSLGISFR